MDMPYFLPFSRQICIFVSMDKKDTHDIVKALKQEFFAYRNGAIVDLLRKNNDCHKMILGLNIPQLKEIAERNPKNKDVAEELWSCIQHRECRLAAPLFVPIEEFTTCDAERWIETIENEEIADFLCFRLLRYLPYAPSLVEKFITSENELIQYTILRLLLNLLLIGNFTNLERAQDVANIFINSSNNKIHSLACRIKEELLSR